MVTLNATSLSLNCHWWKVLSTRGTIKFFFFINIIINTVLLFASRINAMKLPSNNPIDTKNSDLDFGFNLYTMDL